MVGGATLPLNPQNPSFPPPSPCLTLTEILLAFFLLLYGQKYLFASALPDAWCYGRPTSQIRAGWLSRYLAKAILSEGALKAKVTKNSILYPCFAIFQCNKKGSTYATVQGVVGTSSTIWPSRVTEENPTEPSTQATSQYLNSNRYKLFTASQCGRSVSFHLSPASESVGTSTSICASSPGP